MIRTSICDLLGIKLPIIQAPISNATCPELAAAVSNSGGLGMLSVTWRQPDKIRAVIRDTRSLTQKPFGVNLVLESGVHDRLNVQIRCALLNHRMQPTRLRVRLGND